MSMKIPSALMVLVIIFLNGCSIPSIGKYTKSWIGRSIEEKKKGVTGTGSYASRIGWKEKTYPLDNGNWVYVEADSNNCFVHWEVNPQGIIVDSRLEGNCY
ncbi:MAG: hypothetical protein WA133_08260 [Syntrophales bacterium]